MKYGRIAVMMGAILASGMGHETGNTITFKKSPDRPIVPFNPSATWHPQAGRITGQAKQRRASIKTRNINRQKRHPNYRSAS